MWYEVHVSKVPLLRQLSSETIIPIIIIFFRSQTANLNVFVSCYSGQFTILTCLVSLGDGFY